MKPSPLHSLLFFLPDELSNATIYNIIIGILCILLAFSLIVLYRRIKYGSSFVEGMTTPPSPSPSPSSSLDPAVVDIQSQTASVQTIYDKLKKDIDDQKNRIDANSNTLLSITSRAPDASNSITHADVNTDDPSKTKIPSIDMS
jgi:hypothetical protein